MLRKPLSSLVTACAAVTSLSVFAAADSPTAPPSTRVEEVREVLHGMPIVDPYRWLEDQKSPETRKWIDEQNAYTHKVLGAWPGHEGVRRRLEELMRIDTLGVPRERGGRYFFLKRRAADDLFVVYVRKGADGPDEVLIDPHPLSTDHSTSADLLDISHDGTQVVYGLRQGGEDEESVRLLDVATRKELGEALPKGRYFGVSLTPDKKALYYSRHGSEGSRVYRHVVGTDPARDQKIFGDGYGPEKIIGAGLSEDGRYLLVVVFHGSAADRTEVYVQDLARQGPLVPIVNDVNARFLADIAGDRLYLQTNWNAPKGRIMEVDLSHPARERWRELVPEGKGVIRSFTLAGGRLFVNLLEDVVSHVTVYDASGARVRDIAFPGLGTVRDVVGRWDSNEAFFVFTSFHVPTTVYRYDVETGSQAVWYRLAVPFESDRYEVRQVWYSSRDGTRVPMFLVHRMGLKLDGGNPTLMTGYGGFTASQTPAFSAKAAFWVEAGGVFALPNLRGGGEFGEEWHKGGMLDKKQNVFDDFLGAAEWLVANGYTSPSRLAITGNSNGGLLVGAALTQRPDLFAAAVCGYPLLDMLRYHRFLVASFWVPEYGSSDDAAQFAYLRAYSPYHRVKKGTRYPAVLFITGDSDTRVDPLHARKMTALLQASTASDKPVLLQYDTKAGHSGGKPLAKQIEDTSDELSFLFWQLGMSLSQDRGEIRE